MRGNKCANPKKKHDSDYHREMPFHQQSILNQENIYGSFKQIDLTAHHQVNYYAPNFYCFAKCTAV